MSYKRISNFTKVQLRLEDRQSVKYANQIDVTVKVDDNKYAKEE